MAAAYSEEFREIRFRKVSLSCVVIQFPTGELPAEKYKILSKYKFE